MAQLLILVALHHDNLARAETSQTERVVGRRHELDPWERSPHRLDDAHLPGWMQVCANLVKQHNPFRVGDVGPQPHDDFEDVDRGCDDALITVTDLPQWDFSRCSGIRTRSCSTRNDASAPRRSRSLSTSAALSNW